jgi:hypothetical protein
VETGVEVGRVVGATYGSGVHVGGRDLSVAVGEGIKIVGIVVGHGKGLREESGLLNIDSTTIATTRVATSVTIVKISQIESFFILKMSLQSV